MEVRGSEKPAPLQKTPSVRGKACLQTHGSPGRDLFKGALKDLLVSKERYEGNRVE